MKLSNNFFLIQKQKSVVVNHPTDTDWEFSVQKNGYYPLDYWMIARDSDGKPLYSPHRLLKVINYMMKASTKEARACVKEKNIDEFRNII